MQYDSEIHHTHRGEAQDRGTGQGHRGEEVEAQGTRQGRAEAQRQGTTRGTGHVDERHRGRAQRRGKAETETRNPGRII